MNRKNFILGVFGVLFAIVLISNVINMPPREVTTAAVTPAPKDARSVTARDLIDETQRILDNNFPNGNWIDYDAENAGVRIYLYSPAFTVDALNAALSDIKYLQKWNGALQSLVELEAELLAQYEKYGHPELVTVISLVNPEDLTQIFATISGGSVIYDLVDATPPGEQIASGADQTRAMPSAGASFVLNTSSHKYHDPSCGSVKKMDSANRWDYTGTREEVEALGYEPCQICGG